MIEHEVIAQTLADFAPIGWRRAWLTAAVEDGYVGDIQTDYIDAQGQEAWSDVDSPTRLIDMSQALVNLRAKMKQEGHSEWTICKFSLTPGGKFSTDFTYNE